MNHRRALWPSQEKMDKALDCLTIASHFDLAVNSDIQENIAVELMYLPNSSIRYFIRLISENEGRQNVTALKSDPRERKQSQEKSRHMTLTRYEILRGLNE